MTRQRLLALLGGLAGGTTAAAAIVVGILAGGPLGVIEVDCVPGSECVLTARPALAQCPALITNGGDAPTCDPVDSSSTACRLLYTLAQNGALEAWHTTPLLADGGVGLGGCVVSGLLTREQADAWREVLTGTAAADGTPLADITDAPAILGGGTLPGEHPPTVAHGWAGGSLPEQRTEVFDLGLKDAGP